MKCARRSREANNAKHFLPHEVPQGPWEKLGIDFFEFQSTTYLLIADYYSRFPVIRKVRSTNANATTETLKQVFSEYGVPQTVMTDNGPPFSSKEFAAFANQYCFDHVTSSPRYPQSNGFIERMVQTVKQSMKKCAAAGHDPNFSYAGLQSHAPYYQHTVTWRTIEWTKVQSITSKKIPYPESPLPGCPRTNGERQGENVRALQQDCKRSTVTSTESESVRTSSSPI